MVLDSNEQIDISIPQEIKLKGYIYMCRGGFGVMGGGVRES